MPRVKQRTYVAIESFASELGDATAGTTLVSEDSPLYKAYPQWFRALPADKSRPVVEDATAKPGETRGDDAE